MNSSTCPHCGYCGQSEWDADLKEIVFPEHGSFFELELSLKRKIINRYAPSVEEQTILYGCPACNKTFIR